MKYSKIIILNLFIIIIYMSSSQQIPAMSTIIRSNSSYIWIAICIISVVIVAIILSYPRFNLNKNSTQNKPTVSLNKNITTINDDKHMLCDYYILSAYNCCVSGPYNQGVASITNMLNAIALGYRFLDFEIYSSPNEEPIISCSTSNAQCGSEPESYNYVSFSDVMKYINMYAFANSGCMNFNDPLIINLRIKTCNVNVLSSIADIFDNYRSILLGPDYSYNTNNSNFVSTQLSKLKNKVSVLVESDSIDYTINTRFMEYVNCSKVTGFLNIMTQSEFTNMKSLPDMIEYNKQNLTIIVPNPKDVNPQNTILEAYQYAGCQCVCMLLWQNDIDTMTSSTTNVFNKYKTAFVLKPLLPQNLRYNPPTVKAAKPQSVENSYNSRHLDTGVAGITYKI
jgi:Phosphatidylinositol-specific phospholipase C, X domain